MTQRQRTPHPSIDAGSPEAADEEEEEDEEDEEEEEKSGAWEEGEGPEGPEGEDARRNYRLLNATTWLSGRMKVGGCKVEGRQASADDVAWREGRVGTVV